MSLPLPDLLSSQRVVPDATTWQPRLLDLQKDADRMVLAGLFDDGAVMAVHDTLEEQLSELMETREPSHKRSPEQLRARVREHLGATAMHQHGRWVHFPWSRRLVHVLPEPEFRELRTSRNRNKITAQEQEVLRGLTLGVVGLSVGQATAVTLALEEVGGHFKLADFDTLALSNMNRLRAGVHELGLNKAVLTAREILEINPYARISVYLQGITEDNIEAFLLDTPRVSILFDECDDLQAKVMLRERARVHRIPVLMESSDRGLIDVERFDLEPERPSFHGLLGNIRASSLKGLTTYQKVPVVMRILGGSSISPRMAASLVDVESTLKTWPQLGSGVALGGALNTDVARRVALGQFTQSGRYYVDPEELIRDQAGPQPLETPQEPPHGGEAGEEALPPLRQRQGAQPTADELRTLVAYAATAPSGGNCQPWRFKARAGRLTVHHDVERSRSFLDWEHRGSYAAFGALAENLHLAAQRMGWRARMRPFPDGGDPRWVLEVALDDGATPSPVDAALAAVLEQRATNRRRGPRAPLEPEAAHAMTAAAAARGGHLQLLTDGAVLKSMGELLGEGDRLRFLHRTTHREMYGELRFSPSEALRTRDGIDVATLEMSATELAGLQLCANWPVMRTVGLVGGGAGLERNARESVASASALGLISVRGTSPLDWLNGGRAMQRVWLAATAHGLAFQPMTALTYLFARLERGAAEGFTAPEAAALRQLRARYLRFLDVGADVSEVMLFRVAKADAPSVRAVRRLPTDILTMEE